MSVNNGENVEASLVNSRYMSRTTNTSTTGVVALNNASDPNSGPSVSNTQRAINETFGTVGIAGVGDPNALNYSSEKVISDGDTHKEAIEKLDAEFSGTGGHAHSGVDGDGTKISASNLDNFNKLFSAWQDFSLVGASGTSVDVSAQFTGKTPGGTSSVEGVVTTGQFNKVAIFKSLTGDSVEDAGGQKVFGRLTESSGTWTLSFYTNEAGVETAHNLSTVDIKCFYIEVFNQQTRPTIPSGPEFGSLDLGADVVDASLTERGLVNTGTQSFSGNKTFQDDVAVQSELSALISVVQEQLALTAYDYNVAGLNQLIPPYSFVIFSGVGATSIKGISATYNGMFIVAYNNTGATISIVNESGLAATGEKIKTSTGSDVQWFQNHAAVFIFEPSSDRWVLVSISQPLPNINAFGGSPNANGATFNQQTGILQVTPAANGFPGSVSTGAQDFSGQKTFINGAIIQSVLRVFSNLELGIEDNAFLAGASQSLPTPTKTIVRLTNAGLTSINRIQGGSSQPKVLFLMNNTGASVTILNNVGSPASDRILCPGGVDATLESYGSFMFIYEPTGQYWRLIGGAGGGGSSPVVVHSLVTGVDAIAPSGNIIFLEDTGLTNIAGITSQADGYEVTIYNNTTNVIYFSHNSGSAAAGEKIFFHGFTDVQIENGACLSFIYNATSGYWQPKNEERRRFNANQKDFFGSVSVTGALSAGNGNFLYGVNFQDQIDSNSGISASLDGGTTYKPLTNAGLTSIAGINPYQPGQFVILHNKTGNLLDLEHLSGSAPANGQFQFPNPYPYNRELENDHFALFIHNQASQTWKLVNLTGNPFFGTYSGSSTTISSTETVIDWSNDQETPNYGVHSGGTFSPILTGLYDFQIGVKVDATFSAGEYVRLSVRVGGGTISTQYVKALSGQTSISLSVSGSYYLARNIDTLDVTIQSDASSPVFDNTDLRTYCFLSTKGR
jgi:hypothetical protein